MELIQLFSRLHEDTFIKLNNGNLFKGYIKEIPVSKLRDFINYKVLKVSACEKGVINIRIE